MYGNVTERSFFSRGNSSTTRILGAHSFIRGQDPTILELSKKEQKNQIPGEDEIDENPLQLSDGLSEAEPNDFGYFSIIQKFEEKLLDDDYVDPRKSQLFNIVNKAAKNANKFSYKKMNLIKNMNELEYDEYSGNTEKTVKNDKELIFNFAKEENDYNDFNVPSVSEQGLKGASVVTMSSRKDEMQMENENLQTYNSFVVKKQYYDISRGNIEHAYQLNYEYNKKKERYEVNLIMNLIEKYEDSTKPGSKVILDYPEPYQELRKESAKFLEKFRKTPNPDKIQLTEFKFQATSCIMEFIRRIEKAVDDKPSKNNEFEVKKFKNYSRWKKKLSELVNIWELFSSNGIELQFPVKYLILKKYFSARAHKRQTEFDSNLKEEESGNLIMQIVYALLGITQSKMVPKSIFMPNELINILFEVLLAFLLLYSLFSIPIVEFLGYQNSAIQSFEKFVDVIFYIELIINFRKVYKDKTNEYVYDISRILKHYLFGLFLLDFCSTIPWYFFFLSNMTVFNNIKTWVMCFKILRIIKLSAVLTKLESMKGANYVRLFKLVFIFFFFAHWMGCILYFYIDKIIQYNTLQNQCYYYNNDLSKENLIFSCRYFFSIYTAAYIIPGQYTNDMNGISILGPSSEYAVLIVQYMIGQVLSAYIFGGMASVIQNLNQGQNFFTNKMDMLNEHMMFYEVDKSTMKDVKIYFEYMWQRHKDVIYGKYHFDLLSRSLREKFERLNLPGNEILLATFFNLNIGNSKLIGNILMNLSKVILFPFEILFEEGSVTKGIYILLNGDVQLENAKIVNLRKSEHVINYGDIITTLQEQAKKKDFGKKVYYDEKNSVIFPLVSALIKTGRNWQRCYSKNFADLLFLPIAAFDQLIFNFPIEMHILKHKVMEWVSQKKLFENTELFNLLSQHSSRSVSKYFEKEYDKISIWISIPIPISQRKISGNYIDSFIKKVRNQWKEILLMGDLNMCLSSYSAISVIKSSDKKEEKDKIIFSNDPLDNIKILTKEIDKLTEKYANDYDSLVQ